jgi:ribosomal-protein-alanine N-acetyltransferase
MNHLPVLTTERLILREVSILDADDLFEYARLPYIGPNAGWKPHSSIEESINVIHMFIDIKTKGELGVWAIVEKQSRKMVGTIELYNYVPGFKAELGYVLNPRFWGKGLTAEAGREVLKYAFNHLGLKRVEAGAFVSNHQSIRVCEKLGFTCEGVARKGYLRYDGAIMDKVMFGITDDEFNEMLVKGKFGK